MIELYGPKIKVIRWYFENDAVIKQGLGKPKRKSSSANKKKKRDVDDYYDEDDYYEEEFDNSVLVEDDDDGSVHYIEGVGFTGLDEEASKLIEDCYQDYKKTQLP